MIIRIAYRTLVFFLLLIASVGAGAQKPGKQTPSYEYAVITNPDHSYGYDIMKEGRRFIHQPNIPGREGNGGFNTKADAVRVAELVIIKLKTGQMPPVVTQEELKRLKL